MKAIVVLILYSAFFSLIVGCEDADNPNDLINRKTIKTVEARLFSFDDEGRFPVFETFKADGLGVSILPDSTVDELGSNVQSEVVTYTNHIDSLNVFTIYDFDENHLAGSNINDILLLVGDDGQTFAISVESGVSDGSSFKLSSSSQNDTIQFKITGRITFEGTFQEVTKLVILD